MSVHGGAQSLYKRTALRLSHDGLAAIIREANRELSRANPAAFFVTMFAGILDIESGELQYASAGHDEPYVLAPRSHPPPASARGWAAAVRR